MNLNLNNLLISETKEEPNQCVVRISTIGWYSSHGFHTKKSLKILKSKSHGGLYECVVNDLEAGNADLFNRIINIDECIDGLYYIITVNEKRDWETGYIDDWDYKLIPYKEE